MKKNNQKIKNYNLKLLIRKVNLSNLRRYNQFNTRKIIMKLSIRNNLCLKKMKKIIKKQLKIWQVHT